MIEEIKRKKGSSYRAVVYGHDGKRQYKTFRNKTFAKEWERRILRERDEQEASGLIILESGNLDGFSQRWLKEKVNVRCANSTRENYERVVRKHLVPSLGQKKLKDIRVDHANQLVAKLKNEGYSPKGINVILGVLLTLLNDAVEWQVLARSPLFKFKSLKEPESHGNYWTRAEIDYFLRGSINDPLHDLYVIALNTGMRRGEICGLLWDRVDFINGQIIVSRTLDRFGLNESTKSGKKRIVPMSPIVKEALNRRFAARNSEYVFCDENAEPMDAHHLYRVFERSQKQAGFTKVIRFHDLRHTFASHFMMNGGNRYDLQKILGHATQEMTERYAHLSPDHLANAMQVVSFASEKGNVANISDARKIKNSVG